MVKTELDSKILNTKITHAIKVSFKEKDLEDCLYLIQYHYENITNPIGIHQCSTFISIKGWVKAKIVRETNVAEVYVNFNQQEIILAADLIKTIQTIHPSSLSKLGDFLNVDTQVSIM
jgi:hypothetical protein